jgi:lipopolysaccharide/colanic/teichoic acid biosynthesis glycosyltransferase
MTAMYTILGKRVFDVIFCGIFMLVFGWAFILICFAYLAARQFPIFFSQPRLGRQLQEFRMYKFRTLHPDMSRSLQDRRFRLGDFMRWTNLDELPQVWNVLKGEMSWVGPRPLPIGYASFFENARHQRFLVKPGITGLAQVNGKNRLSWDQKFEFDEAYARSVTFACDVAILFKSVWVVLSLSRDVSLDEKPLQK